MSEVEELLIALDQPFPAFNQGTREYNFAVIQYQAERSKAATLLRTQQQRIQEQSWRTIDSAPKDGTHILLAWEWNNGTPPRVSEAFWRNDMPFSSPGVWWYFSGRMFQEPSHWMPLPTPPAISSPRSAE